MSNLNNSSDKEEAFLKKILEKQSYDALKTMEIINPSFHSKIKQELYLTFKNKNEKINHSEYSAIAQKIARNSDITIEKRQKKTCYDFDELHDIEDS